MQNYYKKYFDTKRKCEYCGKIFLAYSKAIKKGYHKGRFCSLKCLGVWNHIHNSGENSWNWKGGKYKDAKGYILVIGKWENGKRTKIMEHRKIMEDYLGRKLEIWEHVHHKNGKKDDNRLKNLEIVIMNLHYGQIRCPHCLKTFLIK